MFCKSRENTEVSTQTLFDVYWHFCHWMLSLWQLPAQSVSKWQHFRFSVFVNNGLKKCNFKYWRHALKRCIYLSKLQTGEFPVHMASNAENVSIWFHHHVIGSLCTELTHWPAFSSLVGTNNMVLILKVFTSMIIFRTLNYRVLNEPLYQQYLISIRHYIFKHAFESMKILRIN